RSFSAWKRDSLPLLMKCSARTLGLSRRSLGTVPRAACSWSLFSRPLRRTVCKKPAAAGGRASARKSALGGIVDIRVCFVRGREVRWRTQKDCKPPRGGLSSTSARRRKLRQPCRRRERHNPTVSKVRWRVQGRFFPKNRRRAFFLLVFGAWRLLYFHYPTV